ncbi:MAG: phage portal protein [Defluviitaleaceae bacterium]|nr:phage portal protein [Defluviitaleaceae bacterium]
MFTYQDYLSVASTGGEAKHKFIADAVAAYKNSDIYRQAITARAYYNRQNTEILRRSDVLLSTGERSRIGRRSTRPVNRKCSGFFAKTVNQLSMYLLGNGVTLPEKAKATLGVGFDTTLQRIGRQALIDGVCYGYYTGESVIPFTATEFFGLPDERTSELMLGFRFYRVDESKPLYIEMFERDGVTVYKMENEERKSESGLVAVSKKEPYSHAVLENANDVELYRINYNTLPIAVFCANDEQASLLTCGLKHDIDLFDRIMSDFGDNLDRANDIYYVVQNYGGANLQQLIDEIEEYRAIYTDGNAGAEIHTIEVPYAARSEALRLLERQMYKETQTLDTEELSGGGLTNVAIKAAMTELDLKADLFEWHAEAFVLSVLALAQPDAYMDSITFKRRSLVNDAEVIDNIYKMRGDIDRRTALRLNPLISESQIEEIMEKLKEEA